MATASKPNKLKVLAIWLISQSIPAGFAVFISFYLLQHTTFKFEYAIPLMIGWGALGAAIHYLSLKRGMKFRVIMSVVFLFLTVGAAYGLNEIFKIDHSKLHPCPVCGYVALPDAPAPCLVCKMEINAAAAQAQGFDSEADFLIAAQTTFFMPIPPDTAIDFFAVYEGPEAFARDASWQPIVSKADVLEVQKMVQTGAQ